MIQTLFSLSPEEHGEQGAQGTLPSVFTLEGFFLWRVGWEGSEFSSRYLFI